MINKHSAYELAVWQAKAMPEQNHELIVNQTNQALGSLAGFQTRTIFQSVSNPQLLFDWVEWDNAENAASAAQQMMSIPELKSFVGLIDKTLVFEHYRLSDTHQLKDIDGAITELVVYQLAAEVEASQFQHRYSYHLSKRSGYQGRYLFSNTKGENQWAELVFWENEEAATAASQALHQIPEMGELLQGVKEAPMVHQYFKKFV